MPYCTRGGRDLALPAKFEICTRCEGRGTHVNPSIDGHGISPEEFAEDPDFEEAYFEGRYDVQCYECHGERVVKVIDREKLSKAGQRLADVLDRIEYDDARDRADERMTRLWENGGRE